MTTRAPAVLKNSPQRMNLIFSVSAIFWIEYQAPILDIGSWCILFKSQAPPYAPCVIFGRATVIIGTKDSLPQESRGQSPEHGFAQNVKWIKGWWAHLHSLKMSFMFMLLLLNQRVLHALWKSSPGWWWITNRLGWLLEFQTELFNNNK